jgi:hypothetical protein
MAKKSRRHYFGRVKKYVRRHKSGIGGIGKPLIAGGAIGLGINVLGPTINSTVPHIGPFRPTTVVVGGGSLLAKFLHKGGIYADIGLGVGAAMAAGDLLSGTLGGFGVNNQGQGATGYANDQ